MGKKYLVLIVDDIKENRLFLRKIIESMDYNVQEAANGKEGLKISRLRKPDLIISDILMPVMDGFLFCREVKKDDKLKNIPFIFYTATYTSKKDEEFALKLGAEKFIIKPLEPVKFIKIIQSIFRDVKKGMVKLKEPALKEDKEVFKLYNERLVNKLEKKMLDLEKEITERKQAEEEARKMHQSLVEAHEKLQQAYEEEKNLKDKLIQSEKLASLGQMGAKIAHEINNPLTVIIGRTQLYQMKDIKDEKLKKIFDTILRECLRIKNITSTYRNLSRPALPKFDTINLNEVLEESIENLITTGEIKHYSIKKELQPDLPNVIGDRNRLIQVFRNLVVNASHAMTDSEEKVLTLRSSVSKNGKFTEISIQDTGSGIEKGKLDKIFEVYYTTKPDGLGTGLGLVVVKDIIEKQHKGRVFVESEVGKGTTFTVQLPLKVERDQKKILIADDEAYTRGLYTKFFEYKGLEVFTATNGKEALDNYAKIQPDIVLSDIEMPVMNGFELAEKIREREPEQKIIFVTGFYFEHFVTERLKKANIPFFTKPVDLNDVWKIVSEELKKSSTPLR